MTREVKKLFLTGAISSLAVAAAAAACGKAEGRSVWNPINTTSHESLPPEFSLVIRGPRGRLDSPGMDRFKSAYQKKAARRRW